MTRRESMFRRGRLLLPLVFAVAGCGSDDDAVAGKPLAIPEGCNPIAADWDCMLPFPSDHYRSADESLPGQHRLVLSDAVKPKSIDGVKVDLTTLHPADGFSPGSQILLYLPGGVDSSGLVFHDGDIDKSLAAGNSTLLIDAESGAAVPHFAETDPRADDDSDRGLVIRPLVRLADQHRYVVAVQKLDDASGAPHSPPEAFRRIRDKKTAGDPLLGPLGKRYEKQIFPVLAQAGVNRGDLLLAWDFTTRTEENAIGDMLAVREHMLGVLKQPLTFQVTSQKDAVSEHIWRQIEGSVKVPLFLEKDAPYARLFRDGAGKVVPNGEVDVPFSVIIPPSVGNRPAGSAPARLLQYGHGFFGTRAEAEGHPAELADEKGFVVLAANWVGMSDEDRIKVTDALIGDTSNIMLFTDRLHQAMANFIAVGALAQGELAKRPELMTPAGPAYDPSTLYFHGNSLGHILGSSYVALSPSIERAALGVGGADFSFMMFRAQPFALFLLLMGNVLPSKLDQLRLSFMTQLSFDRIDPIMYAPRLLSNTFAGSPAARRVLLHSGIGDPAVPPLSAELQARSLGVPQVSPAPRPIWGITPVAGLIDGSAFAEFDFKIQPQPGYEAIPPVAQNEVHEGVRRLASAREQISRFLKPGGKVEPTCDGVCDPE
ncbi:MAG: hypothetical protein IPI67_32530 [Myxococcales bacterium]|nr:hypothetical protein [Myxococcales bacterium]